jgi:hypothetical protein
MTFLGAAALQFVAGSKSSRCSCLRTLAQFCQEPTSGVFQAFLFAPAFLSVPVVHAHKKAWSDQYGVQRISAPSASGA